MAQIGHGGRRIKSVCVQRSPSPAPYAEAEHSRPSLPILYVAAFTTLLHIIGQMDWMLMAQNLKAYSVTTGEGEVITVQVPTSPHASWRSKWVGRSPFYPENPYIGRALLLEEHMGREVSLLPREPIHRMSPPPLAWDTFLPWKMQALAGEFVDNTVSYVFFWGS